MTSAGLLMYRLRDGCVEVLLVHPGGPFYRHRDDGTWSIPKGEVDAGEELLEAAQREFREETGFPIAGPFLPLPAIRQKSGKRIQAWAFAGDCDPETLVSNTFELEWPPNSGRTQSYPEVDAAAFFELATARRKVNPGQLPLLDALAELLDPGGNSLSRD